MQSLAKSNVHILPEITNNDSTGSTGNKSTDSKSIVLNVLFILVSLFCIFLTPWQVFVLKDPCNIFNINNSQSKSNDLADIPSDDQSHLINLFLWIFDGCRLVAMIISFRLTNKPNDHGSGIKRLTRTLVKMISSLLPFSVILFNEFGISRLSRTWIIILVLPRLFCSLEIYPLQTKCHYLINALRKNNYMIHIQDSTLLKMIHILMMVWYASFLVCLWFYLGYHYYDQNHKSYSVTTWASLVTGTSSSSSDPILSAINLSFYFIVQTSFTIGFGDIHPTNLAECIFSIILIFNTLLMFAYLISSTASYLENRDVTLNRLRSEMDQMQRYLTLRGISSTDIDSVRLHFDFLYGKQLGVLESKFMPVLPPSLRMKILDYYATQLETVPYFKYQTKRIREQCMRRMEFRVYTPGSMIYKRGELKRELILIRSGRIELYKDTGSSAARTFLVAGDFFGCHQLVFGSASEFFARASTFSEVLVLEYTHFADVLDMEDRLVLISNCSDYDDNEVFDDDVSQTSFDCSGQCSQALADNLQCMNSIPLNLMGGSNSSRRDQVSNSRSQNLTSKRAASMRATILHHIDSMAKFEKVASCLEKNAGNKRMALMLRAPSLTKLSPIVILPSNQFRLIWDVICILSVFYYLLVIPIRLLYAVKCNFKIGHTSSYCLTGIDVSLYLTYVVDLIFLIDTILRGCAFSFNVYENETLRVVQTPEEIWISFRTSKRAVINYLIVFPWDFLGFATGYFQLWRLCKTLSCLLLPELLSDIISFLDREYEYRVGGDAHNILALSLTTLLVLVWSTVSFDSLHYARNLEDLLSSLYWALTTMTTVGFGDIVPENSVSTIFVSIFCILGTLLGAVIIGSVTTYFHKVDISTTNMQHRKVVSRHFLTVLEKLGNPSGGFGILSSKNQIAPVSLTQHPSNQISLGLNSILNSMRIGGFPRSQRRSSSYSQSAAGFWSESKRKLSLSLSLSSAARNKRKRLDDFDALSGFSLPENDKSLIARVDAYFDQIQLSKIGTVDTVMMNQLPLHLKEDIQVNEVFPVLSADPMFRDCSELTLRDLASVMEKQVFQQKSLICAYSGNLQAFCSPGINDSDSYSENTHSTCQQSNEEHIPRGIYFVGSGIVNIVEEGARNTQQRHKGESFSNMFLFDAANSAAQKKFYARASTDCEVWTLSKINFLKLIAKHRIPFSTIQAMKKRAQLATGPHGRALDARSISSRTIARMQAIREPSKLFIDPNGRFGQLRSVFLLVWCIYNLLVLPFRIAFLVGYPLDYSLAIDYAGDILFIIDGIVQYNFLGFQDKDDLVLVRRRIRERYLSSSLIWFHLASIFPAELFLLFGTVGGLGWLQSLSVLRLNRLFRLRELPDLTSAVDRTILQNRFARKIFTKSALQIVKMLIVIYIAAHLAGILFFVIAQQAFLAGRVSWVEHYGLLSHCQDFQIDCPSVSVLQQYVFSVYWAIQVLTTVGYGDVVATSSFERLFTIVFFFLSTAIFASVIVNLQDIVAQVDVTADLFKSRTNALKNFLSRESVSEAFVAQAMMHLNHQWSILRGATGSELREFLPRQIYSEALSGAISYYSERLFFVSEQTKPLQDDLASLFELRYMSKGDFLFRGGEACSELYLILQGEMSLIHDDIFRSVKFSPSIFHSTASITSDCETSEVLHELDSGNQSGRIGLGSGRKGSVDRECSHYEELKVKIEESIGLHYQKSNSKSGLELSSQNSKLSSTMLSNRTLSKMSLGTNECMSSFPSQFSSFRQLAGAASSQTIFANVIDGFLGEYEFFSCCQFSCGAQAKSDIILCVLQRDDFEKLLSKHQLEASFEQYIVQNEKALYACSTEGAVRKVRDNILSSEKIMKMMAATIPDVHSDSIIFLPSSPIVRIWKFAALLVLVYAMFSVPFCIAIGAGWPSVALDVVLVIWSAADIYLHRNHFAPVEEGNIITDPVEITRLYMSQDFFIDFIAAIPCGLISLLFHADWVIFSLCRLIMILHLRKTNKIIDINVESTEHFLSCRISDDSVKVCKSLGIVWLFGHMTSCGLALIGLMELRRDQVSWISANNLSSVSGIELYLWSYLWSIYTIVTVGYGSISLPALQEKIFAIIIMILGAVLCNAGITAVFTSIVSSSDFLKGSARRSLEATLKFCKSNGYPNDLSLQVKEYFSYIGTEMANSCEQDDYRLLSESLRLDFSLNLCQRSLLRVMPIYFPMSVPDHELYQGCIVTICRTMEPCIAIPGEIVYSSISQSTLLSSDIYILRRGSLFYRRLKISDSRVNDKHYRSYFRRGDILWPDCCLSEDSAIDVAADSKAPQKFPPSIDRETVDTVKGTSTILGQNRTVIDSKSVIADPQYPGTDYIFLKLESICIALPNQKLSVPSQGKIFHTIQETKHSITSSSNYTLPPLKSVGHNCRSFSVGESITPPADFPVNFNQQLSARSSFGRHSVLLSEAPAQQLSTFSELMSRSESTANAAGLNESNTTETKPAVESVQTLVSGQGIAYQLNVRAVVELTNSLNSVQDQIIPLSLKEIDGILTMEAMATVSISVPKDLCKSLQFEIYYRSSQELNETLIQIGVAELDLTKILFSGPSHPENQLVGSENILEENVVNDLNSHSTNQSELGNIDEFNVWSASESKLRMTLTGILFVLATISSIFQAAIIFFRSKIVPDRRKVYATWAPDDVHDCDDTVNKSAKQCDIPVTALESVSSTLNMPVKSSFDIQIGTMSCAVGAVAKTISRKSQASMPANCKQQSEIATFDNDSNSGTGDSSPKSNVSEVVYPTISQQGTNGDISFHVEAETYCHLLHIPLEKLLKIIDYFKISHAKVLHRLANRQSSKPKRGSVCSIRRGSHSVAEHHSTLSADNNSISSCGNADSDSSLSCSDNAIAGQSKIPPRKLFSKQLFSHESLSACHAYAGVSVAPSTTQAVTRTRRHSICGDIDLLQVLREQDKDNESENQDESVSSHRDTIHAEVDRKGTQSEENQVVTNTSFEDSESRNLNLPSSCMDNADSSQEIEIVGEVKLLVSEMCHNSAAMNILPTISITPHRTAPDEIFVSEDHIVSDVENQIYSMDNLRHDAAFEESPALNYCEGEGLERRRLSSYISSSLPLFSIIRSQNPSE